MDFSLDRRKRGKSKQHPKCNSLHVDCFLDSKSLPISITQTLRLIQKSIRTMGYDKIKIDAGFEISSKRDTTRERAYIKSKTKINTLVVNLLPNLPKSNSFEADSFFDNP